MNDSATHTETAGTQAAPPVASAPAAGPTAPAAGSRRRKLLILALVVIVCGVGYGAYWFLDARYYESTDDSYVNGDVVQITSEVPGTVIGLHADDTQSVARGQALLELDPADARSRSEMRRPISPAPYAPFARCLPRQISSVPRSSIGKSRSVRPSKTTSDAPDC